MNTRTLITLVALLGTAGIAFANPTELDGNLDSPLTIGDVTLTGGQLLYDPVSYIPQSSGVYASSSDFDVYSNPLTIEFATAPTENVRIATWNRTDTAAFINGVSHNQYGVKFVDAIQIDADTFTAVFNPGSGQPDVPADDWHFGIIGYRVGTAPPVYFTAVPEPTSLALLALSGLALLRRR